MKEVVKMTGAVCAILVAGFLFGGVTVWNHVRMNGIQNDTANITGEMNQRILPEIKKKFDELEAKKQTQEPGTKK